MKFNLGLAVIAGLLGMSMSAAEAAYIVDTGPGKASKFMISMPTRSRDRPLSVEARSRQAFSESESAGCEPNRA